MARSTRQSKILELINKKDIETQEELADELRSMDFNITQATVSRDIKELGLIKILGDNKKYKYATEKTADSQISIKLVNMFRESVISIKSAGNLMVIKTIIGSANAACLLIDKLNFEAVLGSVAGDDTVIVVVKTENDIKDIIKKLNNIIENY